MAAYNKFNVFTQDLVNGAHNMSAHAFKIMLTNTAPVAGNALKGDITEISGGNGYTAGGSATTLSLSNASGTEKVVASNPTTITATGPIGPFRYAVVYNDTQTSPAKPLVCWFDYGSAVSLLAGDTFAITFDATNGLFTLA